MKKPDDTIYLRHILDAIAEIEEYTTDVNEIGFMKQGMVQSAVIHQIQIIGEAARRLSPETRSSYSDIPWQDIVGMRHKLVHDYFGVDLKAVWETITNDLPPFKKVIQQILDEQLSK